MYCIVLFLVFLGVFCGLNTLFKIPVILKKLFNLLSFLCFVILVAHFGYVLCCDNSFWICIAFLMTY